MKTVTLKFNRSLVALAGNPFGKNTFRTQVEPQLGNETEFCVVFPDHIEMVASSFVQGFFSYWLNTMGLEGVLQHIQVRAKDQELVSRIYENLI